MTNIADPVVLYQYKTAPKLSSLLAGLRENAISVSKESLFNFFNIDDASGAWLDQLGAFLNISRPYLVTDKTFVMDDPNSPMDDPNHLMDAFGFIDDLTYKSYIKGIIYKRNSSFTINEIINCLLFVAPGLKIYINETPKTNDIYISATEERFVGAFNLLNILNRKWFGLPTGVELREFKVVNFPKGKDFFIMDYSPMDNPNFLMI